MSQMDASAMDPNGHRQHSRRRHSQGNVKLGRIYIVILLLLDLLHDLWYYWSAADEHGRMLTLTFVVPTAMIDTALFFILFCRQGWARYGLIVVHMYLMLIWIIVGPEILVKLHPNALVATRLIVAFVIDALLLWALICWADIRRVGSRFH